MLLLGYLDSGDDGGLSGLAMFLIVFLGVAIWITLSFFIAKWAERKGQSFIGFLLLGIIISPLIAAIAALIVGASPLRCVRRPRVPRQTIWTA